jgi:hypothetical protein
MAVLSGQKAVTTAGTEVPLVAASQRINGAVCIKALAANTGLIYIGNAGDSTVSSATGFQLSAKEQIVLIYVGDLISIMVDSAVNGEGVCWHVLEVM